MSIFSPKSDYMQMKIEVLTISEDEASVRLRKMNGWKRPENSLSPIFSAPGHGTSMFKEYKRVNAIDQAGNEGKPSIETNTEVLDAIWESCYLYYEKENDILLVPLNEKRSYVLNCPIQDRFTITKIDKHTGGSTVSIHPGYKK